MRCVPQTVTQNVTVNVCHYEQKTETIQVPVTTTRMEERSQKVMVMECVPQTQKYTVQVAVPKQETESFKVRVCVMAEQVKKCEGAGGRVQDRNENREPFFPVTTWKCVAQQVTENVPVTTCIGVAGPPSRRRRSWKPLAPVRGDGVL